MRPVRWAPPPDQHQEADGAQRDGDTRQDVAHDVEADLRRRHQRAIAVHANERVEDFRRRVAALHETQDVAVHGRRDLAGEVRRAAGEYVQRTAALTTDAMLQRIAVTGAHGRQCTRLRRLTDRARGALIHREQIRRVRELRRSVLGSAAPRDEHRAAPDQRGAEPRAPRNHAGPPTATGADVSCAGRSCVAYPDWRRRWACGHMTIRPPITMRTPPIQTHTTSGLKVIRSSAASSRTPASTVYVSSRASDWMPTSVDGSNVGRPWLSKYCRFSDLMKPTRLPSRNASSATDVTSRFSDWDVLTP